MSNEDCGIFKYSDALARISEAAMAKTFDDLDWGTGDDFDRTNANPRPEIGNINTYEDLF